MAHTVFIDGEAGTTGLQIRQRLADLPGIAIASIDPAKRKDTDTRRAMMATADIVVMCLPDDAAREAVALAATLGDDAPRILDASTAHRTAPDWVYGFPELAPGQAGAIRRASYVSNPGCYPTGAIAAIRPLVDAGILPADHPLTINAVSGYSGGGTAMIAAYETARTAPAFELYGLSLEHKHVPEIERHAGLTRRPIFVPSVGTFRQGMLVSVPLHLDTLPGTPTVATIEEVWRARYADGPLVTVAPTADLGGRLAAETTGTDALTLHAFAHPRLPQAVLVARLDNLGKGAAGAAVQNLTLMFGLA
jgi:N-acetyl-gamma-glutamyl-phosphate reductase